MNSQTLEFTENERVFIDVKIVPFSLTITIQNAND